MPLGGRMIDCRGVGRGGGGLQRIIGKCFHFNNISLLKQFGRNLKYKRRFLPLSIFFDTFVELESLEEYHPSFWYLL